MIRFFCCFFALGQAGEVLAKRPNFLIIMADDCTYDCHCTAARMPKPEHRSLGQAGSDV